MKPSSQRLPMMPTSKPTAMPASSSSATTQPKPLPLSSTEFMPLLPIKSPVQRVSGHSPPSSSSVSSTTPRGVGGVTGGGGDAHASRHHSHSKNCGSGSADCAGAAGSEWSPMEHKSGSKSGGGNGVGSTHPINGRTTGSEELLISMRQVTRRGDAGTTTSTAPATTTATTATAASSATAFSASGAFGLPPRRADSQPLMTPSTKLGSANATVSAPRISGSTASSPLPQLGIHRVTPNHVNLAPLQQSSPAGSPRNQLISVTSAGSQATSALSTFSGISSATPPPALDSVTISPRPLWVHQQHRFSSEEVSEPIVKRHRSPKSSSQKKAAGENGSVNKRGSMTNDASDDSSGHSSDQRTRADSLTAGCEKRSKKSKKRSLRASKDRDTADSSAPMPKSPSASPTPTHSRGSIAAELGEKEGRDGARPPSSCNGAASGSLNKRLIAVARRESFQRRPPTRDRREGSDPLNIHHATLKEVSLSLDDLMGTARPLSRKLSNLSQRQVVALQRTPSFLSRNHTPPPALLREEVHRERRRRRMMAAAGGPTGEADDNDETHTSLDTLSDSGRSSSRGLQQRRRLGSGSARAGGTNSFSARLLSSSRNGKILPSPPPGTSSIPPPRPPLSLSAAVLGPSAKTTAVDVLSISDTSTAAPAVESPGSSTCRQSPPLRPPKETVPRRGDLTSTPKQRTEKKAASDAGGGVVDTATQNKKKDVESGFVPVGLPCHMEQDSADFSGDAVRLQSPGDVQRSDEQQMPRTPPPPPLPAPTESAAFAEMTAVRKHNSGTTRPSVAKPSQQQLPSTSAGLKESSSPIAACTGTAPGSLGFLGKTGSAKQQVIGNLTIPTAPPRNKLANAGNNNRGRNRQLGSSSPTQPPVSAAAHAEAPRSPAVPTFSSPPAMIVAATDNSTARRSFSCPLSPPQSENRPNHASRPTPSAAVPQESKFTSQTKEANKSADGSNTYASLDNVIAVKTNISDGNIGGSGSPSDAPYLEYVNKVARARKNNDVMMSPLTTAGLPKTVRDTSGASPTAPSEAAGKRPASLVPAASEDHRSSTGQLRTNSISGTGGDNKENAALNGSMNSGYHRQKQRVVRAYYDEDDGEDIFGGVAGGSFPRCESSAGPGATTGNGGARGNGSLNSLPSAGLHASPRPIKLNLVSPASGNHARNATSPSSLSPTAQVSSSRGVQNATRTEGEEEGSDEEDDDQALLEGFRPEGFDRRRGQRLKNGVTFFISEKDDSFCSDDVVVEPANVVGSAAGCAGRKNLNGPRPSITFAPYQPPKNSALLLSSRANRNQGSEGGRLANRSTHGSLRKNSADSHSSHQNPTAEAKGSPINMNGGGAGGLGSPYDDISLFGMDGMENSASLSLTSKHGNGSNNSSATRKANVRGNLMAYNGQDVFGASYFNEYINASASVGSSSGFSLMPRLSRSNGARTGSSDSAASSDAAGRGMKRSPRILPPPTTAGILLTKGNPVPPAPATGGAASSPPAAKEAAIAAFKSKYAPNPAKVHRPIPNTFGLRGRRRREALEAAANSQEINYDDFDEEDGYGDDYSDEEEEECEEDYEYYWEEVEESDNAEDAVEFEAVEGAYFNRAKAAAAAAAKETATNAAVSATPAVKHGHGPSAEAIEDSGEIVFHGPKGQGCDVSYSF